MWNVKLRAAQFHTYVIFLAFSIAIFPMFLCVFLFLNCSPLCSSVPLVSYHSSTHDLSVNYKQQDLLYRHQRLNSNRHRFTVSTFFSMPRSLALIP
jgi:hypothetical protein